MTLHQLRDFKHWHLVHGRIRPVELTLCDAVLAAWVAGWMLLPALLALNAWPWLPLSLLLVLMPELYHGLRRQLHRRSLLRCDWLDVVRLR